MAKKISGAKTFPGTSGRGVHAASASDLQEPVKRAEARAPKPAKPSPLLDTRVVYCGDNLEQLFVSFDFSSDALTEIDAFFKRTHKVIVALTAMDILDKEIARKLA